MTTGETALDVAGGWQRTSPLAVLFFVGAVVKAVLGNAIQWAATFGSLILLFQQGLPVVVAVAFVVGALIATAATLRYWFFRFRMEDDRVRIREGVFKRRELNVQFDRIQGVNLEQSPVFRLFGLVTVTFDTAGSGSREGQLPAVTPTFAESLRQRVEAVRPHAAAEHDHADAGQQDDALVRLGNMDMIRIGLTNLSVLLGVVAIPFVMQTSDYGQELWKSMFERAAAQVAGLSLLAALGVIVLGLLVAFAALVALAIASAFLRFHGFTLRPQGSALHTRRGLLTRKEMRVEVRKIQQLTVSQGLRMRCLGRFALRAPSASVVTQQQSVDAVADANLTVPLVDEAGVRQLGEQAFAHEGQGLSLLPGADPFTGISPVYVRARLLAVGILPAALATAALLPFINLAAFLAIAWIPLVAAATWQIWRRYGYQYDDHGLSCRTGLLASRVQAFLFRKAQGASVRRSPLQRRKGLATLEVVLASGAVSIPFISFTQACQLRDYILYKAESSPQPWH